jgi:TolB protein
MVILILSLLLGSCGQPTSQPFPTQGETPTPVELNYFVIPLGKYKQVPGCDFNDTPCASGKNGDPAGYHTGIDYWSNPVGNNEPVFASGPGEVVLIQKNGEKDHGMGNAVILEHRTSKIGQPIYTLYAHLKEIDASITLGKCVNQKTQLGLMGASGYGDPIHWGNTPHLHFEFKTKPVLSNPSPKPDMYWGYIPENEPNPNPISWGYLNPHDYLDKVSPLECKDWFEESSITPSTTIPHSTATPILSPTHSPTRIPSENWIGYIGPDENVWLIHPDGAGSTQLTFDGKPGQGYWDPIVGYRNLKWSPDGSMLGFTRIDQSGTKIQAIQMSDKNITTLITNVEGSFDWLPDSHSIIFSNIPYEQINVRGTQPGGLSILEITTGMIAPYLNAGLDERYTNPHWSPQGGNIFFNISGAMGPEVMNPFELGFANSSREITNKIPNDGDCSWSPDSGELVCSNHSDEQQWSDLIIFSNTGLKLNEISNASCCTFMRNPEWSLGNNWITFQSPSSDIRWGSIYIVKPDGSNLTNLVRDLSGAESPEWSPDGKSIAFLSGAQGSININIMNSDGTDFKPVTNASGDVRLFAWQPNMSSEPVQPAPITPTVSPTPIYINLSDPNEVIKWFSKGLIQGDIDILEKLFNVETISYGTGMATEGGRDDIPTSIFLNDLVERLPSHPKCDGYTIDPETNFLMIWTQGWQPKWDLLGEAFSDVLTFSFSFQNQVAYVTAYFTPGPGILELPSVKAMPCPLIEQGISNPTPALESNVTVAQITYQVAEVNLRATPGYINKDDLTDVIVKVPAGAMINIIGGPVQQDGLTWWNVSWNGYTGWIADHTGSGLVIISFGP